MKLSNKRAEEAFTLVGGKMRCRECLEEFDDCECHENKGIKNLLNRKSSGDLPVVEPKDPILKLFRTDAHPIDGSLFMGYAQIGDERDFYRLSLRYLDESVLCWISLDAKALDAELESRIK